MYVLGHYDISDDYELITPPHLLQHAKKQVTISWTCQQREPPITTGSDEVGVSCTVITMKPVRHLSRVTWRTGGWL
jgi:hypothetical protein